MAFPLPSSWLAIAAFPSSTAQLLKKQTNEQARLSMSASAVHKHIVSTYIQIVSSVLTRTATRIFALPPIALPLLSSTLSLRELCSHWNPRSSNWG